MTDFARPRSHFRAIAGLGGFMGIGAAAIFIPGITAVTPDAGMLDPIIAPSAEEVRVEILSPGQTFGGILGRAGLPGMEQRRLLLAFQEQWSPTRLRAGTEVTFRFARGSELPRRVDVAVSRDRLVRLDRNEVGWISSSTDTPVHADTLALSGEIDSDLWSAVVLSPDLEGVPLEDRNRVIDLLARVFQWQLDFSRQVRPGDEYRLVLEREVRPDGSMRSGRILAAELVNSGHSLHAVWFDLHDDGTGGYYDLEGESLRRAFLRAPLEYRRVSSRFNPNRLHPILNQRRPHTGVDYAASTGTPIMATSDGTVVRRGRDGGYGNVIEVRHANGYMTRYAHMNGFASGIRVGDRVSQEQIVGYVGMTGLATGAHLHYEMHRNGQPVDPMTIDIPSGDPIPPEAEERWSRDLESRWALLEGEPPAPSIRVAQGEAAGTADPAPDGQ